MKYSAVTVEDLKPVRTSKLTPRCIVLAIVSGIFFYCAYSATRIQRDGFFSAGQSGNARCECALRPRPVSRTDRGRLLYNRVPKCGSTTMIALMRRLADRNGFTHLNSKVYDRKRIGEREQRKIVELIKSSPAPISFDRHIFFLNFTRFGEQSPVYMNVIREPVERIISSYFYRRLVARQNRTRTKPGDAWLNKKFEHCVLTPDPECTFLSNESYNVLQLPYFCGQEEKCQLLNNPDALQMAKENIEKFYAVVGTLEQINATMRVLEAVLPQFFEGAFQVYHSLGVRRNQNSHKEHVREEVKAALRANLSAEYELYHFVRQRLRGQHQSLMLRDPPASEARFESGDSDADNDSDEIVEY